ncbi:MAG: VWA domain-containing protein, partial [Oscillospiraceae bacterium]|nr:VWA domain-containing protein [Oscillospiraceae bacterium]
MFLQKRLLALFCAVLLFCSMGASAVADDGSAEAEEWKNYIVVIDNSLSNDQPGGTESLGPPTDPDGLRFSAAKYLYEQLEGRFARIALVAFTGNVKTFKPEVRVTSIGYSEIYRALEIPERLGKRDKYTDINNALQEALTMADSFPNGETKIVLITDGYNDITNSRRPNADDPVHAQHDMDTLETIKTIVEKGIKFDVIALVGKRGNAEMDDGSLKTVPYVDPEANLEFFLDFAKKMGVAGGGTDDATKKSGVSNVYIAEESMRIATIPQILDDIRWETKELTLPVTQGFIVPYDGITLANITITFPADVNESNKLSLIDDIDLTDPDGVVTAVRSDGETNDANGLRASIIEDKNYINIKIDEPKAGSWVVSVRGKSGTNIIAMLTMSQNVRLLCNSIGGQVGMPIEVAAWFEKYTPDGYEDIEDLRIYDDSTAELVLTSAETGESLDVITMELSGARYVASFVPDEMGQWFAQVNVKNKYLMETSSQYNFTVLPQPTPLMTP